jgi:NitT/TauT family transport system substrate-binding protein
MRGRRIYGISLLLTTALLAAVVSGCSSSGSTDANSSGQGPELSTVTVDAVDIPDSVALTIAQDKGYFKQQGLTVKVSYVSSTANAEVGFLAHTVDFSLENYVGAFTEEAANPALGLRIIADDLQAAPGGFEIMVSKNSKITSLADLKNKIIAFPAPGYNVGALALDVQLRGYNLTPGSYKFDVIPFPDMLTPLGRGEVNAAFATQPFVTLMESKLGARPLADLMTGEMSGFPLAGWATDAWFLQHYPRTVAAFQRAIEKAQQVAASDQALVRQTIPEYIKTLSPQIANVMPLSTYNTTLSLTRLQRVADVMAQFPGTGVPANFKVAPLVVPLPSGA